MSNRSSETKLIRELQDIDHLRATLIDQRAVLDWFLDDSGCEVWNGHYSTRLHETKDTILRATVRQEINRYRASRGVAPL